jgi:hypothetical protein
MTSLYERGRVDGIWTRESLQLYGWQSARECLEKMEKCYQQDLAFLQGTPKKLQPWAAIQIEYLEGVISAERESLGALIIEENRQ